MKLELLAPAGNLNKMKTAFAYGADAVYFGIPDFSLRVRINDFDLKGIAQGVEYAHSLKRQAFVTLNIFAHNEHLAKLPKYLKELRKIGPDALIVSDPGIILTIKKYYPEAVIHLSTQANCTNAVAAKFWAAQGIKRIILGREVTLAEIKEIRRALPKKIELEYFVHGAMCMAYSGRCFLSKLFVDRSGNLGDCAQPCRWQYDVAQYKMKARGHEEELELVEERHGSYILNSRDLCLIKHLDELVKAGVSSFKIEGRAKSDYYLATVCGAYRQAIDHVNKNDFKKRANNLFKELQTRLVHRGYTDGFLLGGKADQNVVDSHNKSDFEFCGQVIDLAEGIEATAKGDRKFLRLMIKVHNTIKVGDNLEILGESYEITKLKPKELIDVISGETLIEAHGGGGNRIIFIDLPLDKKPMPKIFPLAVLRRKK